ncbi:MAG: DUF4173 domain-containing protein, partial [Coriobacteriales bacterium]|nr:DUF4173 domain-containing protein [Coriobacteriales bacterium]
LSAGPPLPAPSLTDLLLAAGFIVLGFCFWEWRLLFSSGLYSSNAGVGITVFFLLAVVLSFVYLQARGARQNAKSLLMLLVAVAGALPFVLNGPREINIILLSFEACACLLWVMCVCRTSIADRLSGLLVADLLNQTLIIPFANFGRLFTQPFRWVAGAGKVLRPFLFAVVGVIICIPIFALVINLLVLSDDGFRLLADNVLASIDFGNMPRYLGDFILGVPLAAYLFGAVFGNVAKQHTSRISAQGGLRVFAAAHALPRALILTPLVLFVLLYVVYFIAMGSYLFSATVGELPAAYTYAEYARRGFFELCAVATINFFILAGIWMFTRRGAREYPPALRVLSGLLALLTCLLIITAASKMLLYIQTYGLTPLRLYTSWFMALMLLIFLALVTWHIRPYNAARPIIVLIVVFTLGLGLVNTNGLIADYNVERYLSGQTKIIDAEALSFLGDPAMPALHRLQEESADVRVSEEAADAIRDIGDPYSPANSGMLQNRDPQAGLYWPGWNLRAFEAARLTGT